MMIVHILYPQSIPNCPKHVVVVFYEKAAKGVKCPVATDRLILSGWKLPLLLLLVLLFTVLLLQLRVDI